MPGLNALLRVIVANIVVLGIVAALLVGAGYAHAHRLWWRVLEFLGYATAAWLIWVLFSYWRQ